MCVNKVNTLYHKYYMFMYGLYILLTCVQKLRKMCNRNGRNGYILWTTYMKCRKKHKSKIMVTPGIQPGSPASLVMCSISELPRSISMFRLAELQHSSPSQSLSPEDTQQRHVQTIQILCLNPSWNHIHFPSTM